MSTLAAAQRPIPIPAAGLLRRDPAAAWCADPEPAGHSIPGPGVGPISEVVSGLAAQVGAAPYFGAD